MPNGPKRILIDAYYQVLEMVPTPIVIWNYVDGILYANRPLTRLLGFSHKEMSQMQLDDILPAEDLARHLNNTKMLGSANPGKQLSMTATIRSKSGVKIPVELMEAVSMAGSGTIIYSTIVNELAGMQRQIEENLQRVEEVNNRIASEHQYESAES